MDNHPTEVATLAGGCFWCLEAVFETISGVERIESGYAGGHVPHPSYHQVCTDNTGHAEVVRVTFVPQIISYHEILEVFFTIHDPTSLNRQGADVGTRYRSAIFYQTPEQKTTAETLTAELAATRVWDRPIVTEITPLTTFYPAEEYHHQYYRRNADQPYCQLVISPKVAKVYNQFHEKLKLENAPTGT